MPDARLDDVIAALSHALDLTEGQPPGHAQRSCLIGMRLAEEIELEQPRRAALYYALLLKDAGCSSSSARMSEIFGRDDIQLKSRGKTVDWTRPSEALRFTFQEVAPGESALTRARRVLTVARELRDSADEVVGARCDRGAQIVRDLGFPEEAARAVRSLDEYWNGRGRPDGLIGDAIPLLARIASLAQAVDVFLTNEGREGARAMVRRRRSRWFDPTLADAFLRIDDADELWPALESDAVLDAVPENMRPPVEVAELRIDKVAEVFAAVVDAKSPWTADHSDNVARYAGMIGARAGLDGDRLRDLRRCALLHDLGKLAVPNTILDKQGRLTQDELARVREHPRHTEAILARVGALAPLAEIAGAHHERMDGRGYHRGVAAGDLPFEARILAVADVYDALTAERPYRPAMATGEALAVMRRDVGEAFDAAAFAALESSLSARAQAA